MKTFRYKVDMIIEVEAFDDSDAWDAVQDAFGVGEQAGVSVIECKYKEVRRRAS